MKFDESKLKDIAKPYFKTARAGDWEHALRVVKWVKELGVGRDDLDLLITAACIHDIGWSGVAPKGKLDLDEVLRLEPEANKNSSKLISKVLNSLKFTDSQIEKVNRLVMAADNHESTKEDEAVIVDADSLSKLCIEHLEQKYKPESFLKVVSLWEKELPIKINTEKGRELFPGLLSELKKKI